MSSSASQADPLRIAGVLPLVTAWRVDRIFDYTCDDLDLAPGMLVQVPFGGRTVRGIVTEVRTGIPERELQAIKKIVLETPVAAPPLDRYLTWLADRYLVPRPQTYERMVPPRVRVSIADRVTPPPRVSGGALASYIGGRELLDAVSVGRPGIWCVRPPWGTDRGALVTELVSAAPGPALVTVPEVAFGSKVVDALVDARPDAVRIDSMQEPIDRARALITLARGGSLGIGGRATVFAPNPDLSLIVIDDEHDRSYKEERTPRVDARVALMQRARMQSATCVLISAHPRVETGYGALRGEIGYVHAERSVERAARPHVEFVDKPRDAAISHRLHRAIKETLARGKRVGLLVPASGYARALWCAQCRRSVRCPRCESGMRYDRAGRSVDCPRCGLRKTPPDSCPNCGSTDLRYLGVGSERLEEQISRSFPRARVARVDPATVGAAGTANEVDIYVTTWIGTKPALRPDVALVGLLDADALLRHPDFRAQEHAYQAFSEMAEWAGPKATGGRLLAQTEDATHHSLQALARGDYDFFLQRELEARRELLYPPFSELIEVRARDAESTGLQRAAQICAAHGARVLGPAPLRAGEGSAIVAKCRDAQEVAVSLRDLASSADGRMLSFDVDPR
ncbi:MAG: primosomal protein N' [Actinomycetota bacterium]|nr:primosomal protein N' [Actinomycetota bacterium]